MANRSSGWAYAGRLLLELLVVFVGVYAAFALNTWREDRRNEARKHQIFQALRAHIDWVDQGITVMRPRVDSAFIAPFLESLEAGEMPELEPIRLTGGDSGAGLWEAMLQSGGLDVLDAPTIELMHKYFAGLEYGARTLDNAHTQVNTLLYPNLGRDREEFYNTATGELRPRYEWYPRALRQMRSNFRTIDLLGDSALVHLDLQLGARPPGSVSPRSSASAP